MINLNVGCGQNIIPGWCNTDLPTVDISKPLLFSDNTIDNILAEHVIEHVPCHEAMRFLDECYRVLKPGGAIRVCVPSLFKLNFASEEYIKFINDKFVKCQSTGDAVRSGIFHHGHKSWWTAELLTILLVTAGFKKTTACSVEQSEREVFKKVDGHARALHSVFNIPYDEALRLTDSETVIFEAEK